MFAGARSFSEKNTSQMGSSLGRYALAISSKYSCHNLYSLDVLPITVVAAVGGVMLRILLDGSGRLWTEGRHPGKWHSMFEWWKMVNCLVSYQRITYKTLKRILKKR